ncbi:MAG: hypothetical protein CMG62_08475 [Candidatus Marinimicrobia bacterium]|nr:hypothetical protein [Candidatus Neomarinimicrobiota bacterium]|tara:strand:- start:2475 stop:2828 length:354 start_codon:yes stop_codon:yes gene_type:complete
MESIIELIGSNPVYQAITVILILILVYGIMKKIIKLVISIGILLVLYSIYLNYTDQNLPINKEELKDSLSENVDKVKDKAKTAVGGVLENAKNEIIDEIEKKTDNLKKENSDFKKSK